MTDRKFKVVVRSVPQGYKGGAIESHETTVNPWLLCSHFHRTVESARKCGMTELRRKMKTPGTFVGGNQR